jgi:hypothetical protein
MDIVNVDIQLQDSTDDPWCNTWILYMWIYNSTIVHMTRVAIHWYCICGYTTPLYYIWLQYPCIATRVICTILELYIHIYNIHVLHHESYVLSWSCISTCTISLYCTTGHMYYRGFVYPHVYMDIVHVDIQFHDSTYDPWCNTLILYMWIYNSTIVHMTRGAIHGYCKCGYTTPR